MAALVREKFTVCGRDSAITASHLNAHYAARVDPTNGDLANGKPGVNLSGSAADALDVYGEIKGAVNADTVTVQTGGILYLRVDTGTLANVAAINAVAGQGVQTDGADSGEVENTGTVGTGFGRILGGLEVDGVLCAVVDADATS